MRLELFGWTLASLDDFFVLKRAVPIILLAIFWCWETWRPLFGQAQSRWRHGSRNLAIALSNTLVMGLIFSSMTTAIAAWTDRHHFGLLNAVAVGEPFRFIL